MKSISNELKNTHHLNRCNHLVTEFRVHIHASNTLNSRVSRAMKPGVSNFEILQVQRRLGLWGTTRHNRYRILHI